MGNVVGLDASGGRAVPNRSDGIVVDKPSVTVGGLAGAIVGTASPGNSIAACTISGEGNLISGKGGYGIDFFYFGGSSALAAGNVVGLDVSGSKSLTGSIVGTSSTSLFSTTASQAITGGGNLVSGNRRGIDVAGVLDQVSGNVVGQNASGSNAVPNEDFAVVVENDSITGGGVGGSIAASS